LDTKCLLIWLSGQAGERLGPRYYSGRGSAFTDGRGRRGDFYLDRREEMTRAREERHREQEEREREREEREREREEREREREHDEREREREERRREREFQQGRY